MDPDEPGRVEASTLAALNRLGKLDEGVRGPLAEMAVTMARDYDQYRGGDPVKRARLNQELRQTLVALVEVAEDDDGDEPARLSTPVWDKQEPGPADAGPAGGGGGRGAAAPAGQAADAAPTGDLRHRV